MSIVYVKYSLESFKTAARESISNFLSYTPRFMVVKSLDQGLYPDVKSYKNAFA